MRSLIVLSLTLGACAAAASEPPRGPMLGRPASPVEISAADISVAPDGTGLPVGSGSVAAGAAVYAAKCQSCHGAGGAGGPMDRLTGGLGTLRSERPIKTVASFWPYATTLFDYVRRAMPLQAPQSLGDDEVYAVVGYLLSIDGIVPGDAVMDANTLPRIRMPNREGFVRRDP
jgi:mono/diheme cytochrome c family protein